MSSPSPLSTLSPQMANPAGSLTGSITQSLGQIAKVLPFVSAAGHKSVQGLRNENGHEVFGVVELTTHIHQQGPLLWAAQGLGCVLGIDNQKIIGRLVR